MERVWVKWAMWVLAFGTGPQVFAETVMLDSSAPVAKNAQQAESYPSSKWGAAPEKVAPSMGADPLTASREASQWDSGDPNAPKLDVNPTAVGRAPASMEEGFGAVKAIRLDRAPAGVGGTQNERAMSALKPPAGMEASAMRRQGVQEISLIAGDLGFFPKMLFVTRDIPVRLYITGASRNTLCFMMDSFQVRKQVKSTSIEEIQFTPSVPGKYRFYCPVNGMEGNLVVREFSQTE